MSLYVRLRTYTFAWTMLAVEANSMGMGMRSADAADAGFVATARVAPVIAAADHAIKKPLVFLMLF